MEPSTNRTIIWLTEEKVFGYLITLNAYYSRVEYNKGGMHYDTIVENDEFEVWEEPFTYEKE